MNPNSDDNRGRSVNCSRATRAVHIEADPERLAKYDEYPAKARKQRLRNLLWCVVFAVPTVLLIVGGYPWWALLPGILAVWNLLMVILVGNASSGAVYENGLLAAAVVTNENPLQITVMAEMQGDEKAPVCWGVQCFDVKELPLHDIRVGERVPCAAMFGGYMPFAKLWSAIEPHPICWATADKEALKRAEEAIDEQEWVALERLAALAAARTDVDFRKEAAYFNEDYTPREREPQTQDDVVAADPNGITTTHVLWSFSGGKRDSLEQFVGELVAYNREVGKSEVNPSEIAEQSNEIIILCAYEENGKPRSEEFLLTAPGGRGFMTGELLYAIHNRVVDRLAGVDYRLFEGLVDNGVHEKHPSVPYFYLNLGA